MGRAKEVELKVIPAQIAAAFIRKHHYSGKIVQNSQLHFGAFLDGQLHGVLSFGPSTDKRKIIGLVEGTGWNEFIELNRMAFDDYLPRNSESRCISLAIKMIKKQAPHIKWIISFADGCQCGDGTIYRASNFVLTQIKPNTGIKTDGKEIVHQLIIDQNPEYLVRAHEFKPIDGYMLRYIYFIDPKCRKKLTVPEIPFSEIDKIGAGMYKGDKVTQEERHVDEYCLRGDDDE